MPNSNEPVQLVPANRFSVDQLVGIYNQTRVDYMVPMPMNTARLQEYITTYDVDLKHSLVAMQGKTLLGVAMLGVRKDRAWITRLGVIPNTRRMGVGQALTEGLLNEAQKTGRDFVMLEVIRNNIPAQELFVKLGFYEAGDLLVLRRPPRPAVAPVMADAQRLERHDALILVGRQRGTQPWTNQSESLYNANEISGLRLTLADGTQGWLVYQRQKFTLTRFAYKTESGDPVVMMHALLSHLHHQYPRLDTQIENIQMNDPHLEGFYKMGYVESFQRIEMWRGNPPASLVASTR